MAGKVRHMLKRGGRCFAACDSKGLRRASWMASARWVARKTEERVIGRIRGFAAHAELSGAEAFDTTSACVWRGAFRSR